MITELDTAKQELHKILYLDNTENDNIDKVVLKKTLYLLLRECLIEKEYEVTIGSYIINITPNKLSVKYESDQTIIEISNEDVYFETVRDTETRFFCISPIRRNEYPMDTSLIRVTGSVTNIDGICEEHYLFDLYTDENDNIRDYLQLPSNVNISELSIADDRSLMVNRRINKKDKRTDVIDFFIPDRVVPVYLDTIVEKYKAQPQRKEYNPEDYSLLIPVLSSKKSLISFMYGAIVEFYTNYLNENY